jgi:hypothetical protein
VHEKINPFSTPFICFFPAGSFTKPDSLDNERLAKMIDLSEVVVRTDINVPKFMTA